MGAHEQNEKSKERERDELRGKWKRMREKRDIGYHLIFPLPNLNFFCLYQKAIKSSSLCCYVTIFYVTYSLACFVHDSLSLISPVLCVYTTQSLICFCMVCYFSTEKK